MIMKKNNFIRRALIAVSFALALAVMLPVTGSVEVQAAKKVTAGATEKKAKAVRVGTTLVTAKKCSKDDMHHAYLRFKAPKAGSYVFTLSDFKTKGKETSKDVEIGYFALLTKDASGYMPETVKTEGGKTERINICTDAATKDDYFKSVNKEAKKINRYMPKRTATIKLKKGETVWIYVSYTNYRQFSYKLNIKKK